MGKKKKKDKHKVSACFIDWPPIGFPEAPILPNFPPIDFSFFDIKKDDKSDEYDEEGNAKHYDTERINSMVLLERTFGTYETMIFCEMTAMKYRLRIGKKKSQPTDRELLKISWYEKAAEFFKLKLESDDHIRSIGPADKPLQWKDNG